MTTGTFQFTAQIQKANLEQRLVYAWVSVIEENGVPVVDHDGDVIEEQELQKAIHDFMRYYRAGKEMHKQDSWVSEVVEMTVFTKDVQAALGIDLGKVGAFACFKVWDDAVWEKVKSGEYTAFSIGGTAERVEID